MATHGRAEAGFADRARFTSTAAWLLPVTALTVVGALVRFAGLGRQGLWVDETVTASLLRRSLGEMLRELPASESTPPLYYVIAWGWTRVVGDDPTALRSLSALAGTLTIPVAYAAAATLVSRRAGIATAAIATVSPLLVWFSQEARSYALLTLLCALSFAFFAASLRSRSHRVLAGWAIASALALLTHYFAVFLVVVEAAALLLASRRRATVTAIAAVGISGLAVLPLLVGQASGSATWIRHVDLSQRLGETVRQLTIPSLPPIWAGADVAEWSSSRLWPVAVILLLAAAISAYVLGSAAERTGVGLALLVGTAAVAGPVALAFAASVLTDGRGDFVLYRNLLPSWLPVAVVVAGGFAVRRAGWVGIGVVALIVALSCGVLAQTWRDERFSRDDWPAVVRAIRPGAAVVLSPSWEVDALLYHAPQLTTNVGATVEVDEIDVVVRRRAPSYTTLVRDYEPPLPFQRVARTRVQHWEVTRFRSPAPVRLRFEMLNNPRPADASRIVLVDSERD